MNDETDRRLDDELDRRDTVGPEAFREELRAWERLADSLRAESSGPAPAWLEGRVMDQIRAEAPYGASEAPPARRPGALGWLVRPRTVRASPLALGLAAAAVLVLAAFPWLRGGSPGGTGDAAVSAGAEPVSVVYVQFVVEAPGARSVAVAGDFNRWEPEGVLQDPDGDGTWTGRLPLRPGVHEYMFVVDGERWVTDPHAERWVDDGFGGRNAVIAVASPGRS